MRAKYFSEREKHVLSRRPSGLRKTMTRPNSSAHRTAWLKTGKVNSSGPFNAYGERSLDRVVYAIAHHLEVKSIGFEHNSRVRIKNTLWVKTCFSRSEEHFARIKTGKVNNSVTFNANV